MDRQRNLRADRPGTRSGYRLLSRPLHQKQTSDPPVRDLDTLLDDRHAGTKDVLLAPISEGLVGGTANGIEQLAPCRVAVRVGEEEMMNPGLEGGVTDEIVQLLEHARRFVIDDCAVVALCLIEIRQ